ncbi:MAG: hypothetical protein ABSD92_13435 [Candidatus Bathyarchaeia archaeon]|jgi:hypothetical protein
MPALQQHQFTQAPLASLHPTSAQPAQRQHLLGGPTPTPTQNPSADYTVSISESPTNSGSVTVTAGASNSGNQEYIVESGDLISFTASAQYGYQFSDYTITKPSTGATNTVTTSTYSFYVTGNTNIVAYFTPTFLASPTPTPTSTSSSPTPIPALVPVHNTITRLNDFATVIRFVVVLISAVGLVILNSKFT